MAVQDQYLKRGGHGLTGLFTHVRIRQGERILQFRGELLNDPNQFSLQIGAGVHLDKSGAADDELCHSCNPNCFVDFSELSLAALRDIDADEELTINYCCTEEVMACPFTCLCGAARCYGVVRGLAFLHETQRTPLEPYLSPYLKTKYQSSSTSFGRGGAGGSRQT